MALIKKIADEEKKRKASQTVAQRTQDVKRKAAALPKPQQNSQTLLEKRVTRTQAAQKAPKNAYGATTQKYSFDNKSASQMNLAEYTAWANHTNNAYALENLSSYVDTRGTQFWNPYLGGRTTVPTEIVNHFRDNYGYEGPFDEKFIEQFKPYEQFLETSDISWSASKPSAKDPLEKWTGYYYNKIASWQAEDEATRSQWDEYRNALQTYYKEFEDVTGRAPSIEEFTAAVDSNDYSKLAAINESLSNRDSTIQILNKGTYYTPFAIYGLYHALSQGQDISADRDYFQDAVSYYMSPISTAQELKKYSWSGADFTKMSPEDYTTIEHGIINSGDMEELAALRFTRNAAYQDPKDVQIALLVNEAYGYNHDDAWFEKALAAAQPYLDVSYDINGVPTYTKPSSKGTVGEQMAWYIYQESLKREDTAAVEEEWEKVTKLVNDIAAVNREDFELSAEGLDEFTTFIMDEIFGSEEASGLKISTLESYLKGKKDLCRITFASEDNLKAMIARAFTGEEVDAQTNYLVDAPVGENVEEDPVVEDPVVEEAVLPPLYDELQMQEGVETVKEYNTSLEAIKTAVMNLSNSGANISFSDVDGSGIATIPERIKNNAYLSGIFGNLWHEFKKADYVEKLGEDYALNQATASDPILKLLGSDKVDSPVTVRDLNALMDEMQFSSGSGEVSLADGVLALVLPNAEGFQRHINSLRGRYGFQKTLHMLNSEIDVTAYRNAYNRAMEEGLSSDESTAIAFFAATDIAPAVKEQGMQYATAEAQSAFDSVMQAAMSEEGSSDVLAMAEHVASDVASVDAESDFDEIPAAEPVPLGSFLIPMIIGASSKASEGFAALTKDVMHDIATGDITPEDISKGVQMAIASGEKTPNQIQEEVERVAEPEKYALPPELERSLPRVKASEATKGMTDVTAKIGELSAANTPEQKAENKKAIELSDTEKWLEMSDADAHLAVAQAFGYESSPMFSAMSTMEAYGQYFSDNEVREIYTAFQNGEISAEQIMDIVDERISKQSPAVLNASRKPEELADNILTARTYIENQKAGAAVIKPYSDEQLDVLSGVVDMVEQLGVYSYDYLTNATAKDYKEVTGVDLVESGVIDEDIPLADLMDTMVGYSWRDPFKNEGVGLEAVAETGESITRWVTSLPYLAGKVMDSGMDKVAEFFGIKDAWDAWNGTSSQMADVYDEIQKGEKGSELRMQEHAKAHEQLAKEAAVGATKILFSSGVGRWLSGIADASNGVMTTQKLLTLAGQSYDFASLIARTPYAAITGSEEFISNVESGMNLLNSAGRAAISMMIEAVTESPAVDDLLSFKLGSKTLKQGALDGAKKLDPYKNMLLMNFANGIYHELGEEELGIVIDRFITSAGLAAGLEHNVGEAFAAGFEGIGEEAKATALSTALTIIFLNAADMPLSSASYKYLQSMFQKGKATAMDVDILTSMMLEELDAGDPSSVSEDISSATNATPETFTPILRKPKASETPETFTPIPRRPKASETPETFTPIPRRPKASEEELDKIMMEVIAQVENGEPPTPEQIKEINRLEKELRVPDLTLDLDNLEPPTEPLEPESVDLVPDVDTFDNAHDDMPPQVSQEAAKNEEPVEMEEESAVEEPAAEEEIQASPGAQKIAEFITTSEPEVSKALAKDHNQKIVEEMLANDPGIQSKQEELQTVEEEIQALNEKASEHQAEAENATNRQRQAIAAAVSNGLDTNSPQVLNAKFSTSQARDAALQELKKVEEDLKKADGRKTHIERAIEKLREGIELSKGEYEDLDLFMRTPANQAVIDSNKAKNAVPSAVGAEMTTSDIAKREKKRQSKENIAINAYSQGWVTAEEFTDPGRWDVQDRPNDPDAWKPTKAEQEAKNREQEKHIKLNKDFDEELSDNGWVEVNSATYQNIVDQLKEKRGYVDSSLARPKYSNSNVANGVAYVDGIPMDVYGVNGTREDGKTDTGEKYAHITESDQYLIVAKIDNDTPQTKEDLERYKGLTEASDDGDTGLERMRKSVATLSEQLESAQNRKAKLELEIARYKEDLADGKTGLTKKYAKAEEDLKTCKATIRTRQNELTAASKRLDDAVSFVTEFASKVNEDTGIDLEFDEDSSEYHASTREAIEDQKRRNREYIVIDKTAKDAAESARSQDSIASLAEAAGITADNAFLSHGGLQSLLVHERLADIKGEIPESLEKAIRDEVDMMDEEDIQVELLDLYAKRASDPMAAFSAVTQTLVGNKALENFVKQHGGFKNEDGTEGAFTPRGTRTYQVRSDVYNAYLEGSGWMSLKDDPQTGESYRETMKAKIDLYAQERGLTLEERNDLYASHLLNTKDEGGFETVSDDESGVLKVKREFGDSLDTNSAIRDFNGEFNIAKAKEEIETAVMYLDEVLAGLHGRTAADIEEQLKKHGLWVELLEQDGSIVPRQYGQPFIGKDGQTRRFIQPAQWLIDNALRIDLNRFKNEKGGDGSRLNFRIEKPQLNKKTERPYDVDAVHKDTAYLRPESQLKDELAAAQKHFESLMKSVTDMATTTESQQYAAYTFLAAYANLVESKINALSNRWKYGAPKDMLGSMIANMYSLKQKLKNVYQIMSTLDGYGTETGSIESRLNAALGKNRTDEKLWTAAAVKEGKPLLRELQESLDRLSKRYDALVAFGESSIVSKAEMAAVSAMARTYQNKINLMKNAGVKLEGYVPTRSISAESVVEPVAKDNNVPTKRTFRTNSDNYSEIISSMQGKEYSSVHEMRSDLMKLIRIQRRGALVEHLTSRIMSEYVDLITKDMSPDEKVKKLTEMKSYARRRAALGQFTVFDGVDYDKKISDVVNGKASEGIDKETRKKAREQVRQIRKSAGNYKSVKAIDNARSRLDAIEAAGMNVGDLRSLLDANEAKLKGEPAPMNLQHHAGSRINEIVNGFAMNFENSGEDSTWRSKVPGDYFKQMAVDLEDGETTISTLADYEETRREIINLTKQINELRKQIAFAPDEAEKAALIQRRNELKRQNDTFVRRFIASRTAASMVKTESGYLGVDDPSNLTDEQKEEQRQSLLFRRGRAKINLGKVSEQLHKLPGSQLGEHVVYTADQLAEAYSEAMGEAVMEEDHELAKAVSAQVRNLQIAHAYTKFSLAYWRSMNARKNTGMEQARSEFIESLTALYEPRGYTSYEVEDRAKARTKAKNAAKSYENELYSLYTNFGYDFDRLSDGTQQMLDIFTAQIERGKKMTAGLFRTSAEDIKKALNGETGGHMPRQIIDTLVQIPIDASEKKSNPTKPISRAMDTPVRAIRRFLGKNAALFNSVYLAPVDEANANIARRKKKMMDDVLDLNLSKEARQAVTMALENGMDDAQIKEAYPEINEEVIKGKHRIEYILFRIYRDVDEAFRRNGLEPVKWRKNYVPHIQKANPLLQSLGIKTTWDNLPSDVYGTTDDFTPTHQFSANLMAREADSLEGCLTDIVEIMETYINGMVPIIYQTDNIIRLRDLEQAMRQDMKYKDNGNISGESASRMEVFIYYMNQVADQIAGKSTSKLDRALDEAAGSRHLTKIAKNLTAKSGRAATMLNMNVVTANVLPMFNALAESPKNTLRALGKAFTSEAIGDSDFYAARHSDAKTSKIDQKIYKGGYAPARTVDKFATRVIWESAYQDMLDLGMDHDAAVKNADARTKAIMSSKDAGSMPMAYNSSIGSMALQFTQEAVNNIAYLASDSKVYTAARAKSFIGGASRKFIALMAYFLMTYGFNKVTGRETALDPYGSIEKAIKNRGENDTALDVAKAAGINLLETMNPLDNLTEAITGERPAYEIIPFVGNIVDTVDKFVEGTKNLDAEAYLDAILNWLPGGTAIRRVKDTAEVASKGYAESEAGRIKYAYESNPLNNALSALFGLNSSIPGREYVNNGYRTLSDPNTASMKRLMDEYGLSAEDAYRIVQSEIAEESSDDKADAAKKAGEDTTEHEAAAAEARSNVSVPSDVASWAKGDTDAEWFKKGVQIWQESGIDVYPKDLSVEDGSLPEEEIEALNAYYRKQYKYIVSGWEGSAKALKKELDKAADRAKAKYLGGE